MGIRFASASAQYLRNTNTTAATIPVTAYPWSMGAWFYPRTTTSFGDIFSISDTGSSFDYWEIQRGGTDFIFFARAGGGEGNGTISNVISANAWHYGIARAITATNRRIHILGPSGLISSAQDTGNITPTAANLDCITMGVKDAGATAPFDGEIAELWYSQVDILPGGGAMEDGLMRRLAYQGPLSSPLLMANLVEYRSFRKGLHGDGTDVQYGRRGYQDYTFPNGFSIGLHPPLPASYNRPLETEQLTPFNRMFRTGVLDVAVVAGAQAHLLEGKFAGTLEGKFG